MIENYKIYLDFISKKISNFFEKQKPYIKCTKGCGRCCKNAEFPYSKMEMKYLLCGFLSLDPKTQEKIEHQLQITADNKKAFKGDKFLYDCPFLIDESCSVYEYRGIVCRTFGLIENVTNGKSKIPFCAYQGLNYSNVLDEKNHMLSTEKYENLGIDQEPLGFNINYNLLTDEAFEKKFNFKFEEKLPLIDWFMDQDKKE